MTHLRAWFYLGGAAETFEAACEVINCYQITFVKGHFVRRDEPLPLALPESAAQRSAALA